MFYRLRFVAVLAAGVLALPASAQDIMVMDAYARASSPTAKTGAAFIILHNLTGQTDRLISARSDAAKRVELHTHIEADNGVVQMRKIEDGIALPEGAVHKMERGGDHVMLMGLTGPLEQGADISVTLVFEHAGEVNVTIPVDNDRAPEAEANGTHGDHSGHGEATN